MNETAFIVGLNQYEIRHVAVKMAKSKKLRCCHFSGDFIYHQLQTNEFVIQETRRPSCSYKTRATASLYSFCCSTDLQSHPRSTIFILSQRIYATFC